MPSREHYMHRCLQLARLGAGYVAPNPMVGAVLVHNDRIIGEGYHMQYGGPHAEPNCIDSVAEADRSLIPGSVLYVSLEPCAHFGKTPPCADLIINCEIKEVVIGCRDPFPQVNGKGIEKLQAAGIQVTVGVLEEECKELNLFFFTFHTKGRPYLVLKWAQTADGFMGAISKDNISSRVFISNEFTNRLVHKWRSETAAILIGTETALRDDPSLTTRLWKGPNPLRLIIDRTLRLPHHLKIFDRSVPTLIFNDTLSMVQDNLEYLELEGALNYPQAVCDALYARKINSVIIEGGSRLLQSFIAAGLWDEARIITNRTMLLFDGVKVPQLPTGTIVAVEDYENDSLTIVKRELTA